MERENDRFGRRWNSPNVVFCIKSFLDFSSLSPVVEEPYILTVVTMATFTWDPFVYVYYGCQVASLTFYLKCFSNERVLNKFYKT